MKSTLDTRQEDRIVASFAALAVCIHILESAIPMPLPGVKPGLANVVILVLLLRYRFGIAAQVMALRVLVGSLLIGTFMTPTFWLSASGAVASLIMLGVLDHLLRDRIGPIGLAVAAAMSHMAGQVIIAWLVFVPHPGVLKLLPLLLTLALGLGIVTGIITAGILRRLPPLDQLRNTAATSEHA